MAPDAIALVLDELDYMWRPEGPPRGSRRTSQPSAAGTARSERTGTFDEVVRGVGEQRWTGLPPEQRCEVLRSWLAGVVAHLHDAAQKRRWRFRRAWEVAPEAMLGVDFDDVNILAVAATIERDITWLGTTQERLLPRRPTRARRDGLDELIAKYRHPARGSNEWAYLAEAVRVGAEELPLLNRFWGSDDEALDPVPFVLAVYDAMCPGLARPLVRVESNVVALRESVALWRAIGKAKHVDRRASARRGARRAQLWSHLRALTKRGGEDETMWRRWPRVRAEVRLDPAQLLHGLTKLKNPDDVKNPVLVPRDGSSRFDFAPTSNGKLSWVELLLHAVRNAMPRRMITSAPIIVPEGLTRVSLPEAFLVEAEAVLPPVPRGTRGPEPMSNREALGWVIEKIRSGCGWKQLPSGSKLHKRFQLWQRGDLGALRDLTRKYAVLTERQASQLR